MRIFAYQKRVSGRPIDGKHQSPGSGDPRIGQIGPVALAVTTSLNFNFLRKPGPTALIGEAKLLKLGKRLAVGEVALYSQGESEMVAHATGTYSIPVER